MWKEITLMSGEKRLINVNNILMIEPKGVNCVLFVDINGDGLMVHESAEEIKGKK